MPVIGISLLTTFLGGDIYTDHQGTDDQCALKISVAPEVPPISVYQCQLSALINANCQCPLVPHQCHISVPI
ncbi:unnamed protein product [Staurois parvus]|uniref:Secreted protein n=1 Tax=Staurois parvus TaxID=386267 RepID=A0ABN9E2U7_9NEOB|nr:unnamed protein product [Staurois parvus]